MLETKRTNPPKRKSQIKSWPRQKVMLKTASRRTRAKTWAWPKGWQTFETQGTQNPREGHRLAAWPVRVSKRRFRAPQLLGGWGGLRMAVKTDRSLNESAMKKAYSRHKPFEAAGASTPHAAHSQPRSRSHIFAQRRHPHAARAAAVLLLQKDTWGQNDWASLSLRVPFLR